MSYKFVASRSENMLEFELCRDDANDCHIVR